MAEFFFNLQQFATVADGQVTLDANEIYTLDGVDYTANANGAVLKSETTDNGDDTYTTTAITGITSGTVTASLEGKSDPAINFVGDTAFDFNCAENNGALNVKKGRSSLNYTTGTVTYYADKLDIPQGTVGFAGTLMHFLPFNVTMTVPASGVVETLDGSGGATFSASDKVNLSLTFPEGVAENLEELKADLPTILQERGIEITEAQVDTLYNLILPIVQDNLELNFTGEINYTRSPTSISFGENTTTDVIIGERTITFETVDGAAGIGFTFADGVLTITPGDNDGSLNITAKNGDITTFAGNVEISGGSILVDVFKQNISVTAGTTTTVTLSDEIAGAGGRSFAITAEQSTGFDFAIGDDGTITLTSADSNPLNFQFKNGDAVILDRDIAITGSVVIGTDDNSFTITQGTALTFMGETTDTTIATTITATDDAGITVSMDDDGKITLTPGENDGALNITRKRDGTTLLFDYDLNVSGGSMSFDPTSGEFTVAEGTTLEITNNRSGAQTTIAVEGADASCTLTNNSDGTISLNVESGDGKLHVLHINGDGTTLLDNVVEFSGKITFDATNNTFTATNGTTLAVAFDNIELTATVNGDAGININADSNKITITPGEGDGSIDLKLTDGNTTVFDGNLSITGGGIAIDLPTQTITFDAGVAATITVGNRAFTFSLPNGAEQRIVIDDEGKFNLTFEDSEPLHINYTNGTTTIFDADITIDGKVVFVPSANSVSIAKDTTTTIEFADGRTMTFTALGDAGITASMDDEGKLRLAANEDNGEIHITDTKGDTVREMDVEFTGAIVLDATNQKIYAEAGTTLTRTIDALDVVESITVTDDAGFTFTFDDGKVIITPDEGDGKLQITHTQGDHTISAELEISGGSIVFDSTNNSLTVTAGTTTAITAGDYTVELTVTDEAGVTINIDEDGKIVVSAEEGDGELAFTLKRGDTVLNSGSVEFVGSLEFDPNNQTVGVTKDTSATFTLGSYKYSITANDAASITLSEDTGAITVTAPDGDGSLDIKLTKGDEIVFAGNVEYTGSFTIDPANQKISVSDDSQTKITVGDYTVALEATDEASVGFALGDGTITLSAEEGDGKIFLRLEKDGTPLFMGGVEFDGEVTLDVAGQKISVAKDTSLTFDRFGSATTIKALDEAGFTIANDGGKLTITPGEGDGKLQITRTQGTDTFTAEMEINGSITYDTENNNLALTKGTTTVVTIGDYTVELTALDDAGLNFSVDGEKLTITPQGDGGSTHIKVTNGDDLIFENNAGIANGSISFDFANQQFAVAEGTKLALEQGDGDATINITAKDDVVVSIVDNRPAIDSDNQPPDFDPDNPPAPPDGSSTPPETPPMFFKIENDSASFDVTIKRDGTELFNSTVTVGGTVSYRASTNTFALVSSGDSEFSDTESYIETTTGDYTFKAGTDGETAVNSLSIGDDGKITVTFPNDKHNGLKVTATKSGEELFSGHVNIDGSLTYDSVNNKFIVPSETTTAVTIGEYSVVLSVTDEAGFTIDAGSGKTTLTPGDGDGKLNAVIYNGENPVFGGTVEVANGSIVFDGNKRTISVTKGTTTTVTIGEREIALTANDDAGVNIGLDNGKLTITPQDGDGSIDVTYSEGGQVAFANNIEISGGSITVDALTNSVGLTKGTTITLANFNGSDSDTVSFTALDDANITLSVAEGGGLRIEPESGDGDLQLSVTNEEGDIHSASIGIEGAIVYQTDGNISLEKGTTVEIGWIKDGVNTYNLKLTSNGSSGTIAFDADKGLGITADGNLDMELSSTDRTNTAKFNGVEGTLWYNSGGYLTLVEGTSLKSNGTFTRDDIDAEFEAVGGDVYVDFYTNYFTLNADTGTFKITLTDADGNSGIININEGALKDDANVDGLTIIEGSDVTVTFTSDDSISDSLPLTTDEAGNYTINGHKLTTTAEGVQFYATSNGIILATGDGVTCDGMTFTGGNVTLTSDGGHVLGAGVSVAGFDPDNSIVLTEKGSVTVDGRVFELIEDAPLGVTITGAEDGFLMGTSGEDYVFTEKFAVAGDSTYSVQASSGGLEKVRGISADSTITGGAIENGEATEQYFNTETETEGDFTIGERVYNISGDSRVVLEANFENGEGFIRGADDLTGTIRGDFTVAPVTINGGDKIIVHGDDDISIATTDTGLEMSNVDESAFISSLGGVSKINGTAIQVEGYLNYGYISAKDDTLSVYRAYDATITTDAPEKVWVQMANASMTLNDNELQLAGDKDGIWFSNKEIVGLDEGASLTVGEAGTYSTEVVTLEAQAGDVIVGLGDEDAYIYDESNPLITKQTPTEDIINLFDPDETYIVGSESRGRINIDLDGDDLVIVEDTPAWVNINTSSGDDTIVSQGDHVNINLGDGDTWLYVTGGKVTLDGYDQSTGTGFGTNYTDIATAIDRGSIVLGDGKVTLGSAQVDMGGNDLVNFYNRDGELQKVGYVAESDALDASDTDDDLLLFAENYSTVNSGDGDDTIFAGAGAVIDAGDGDNYIELATDDERYERDKGAVVDINDGDNTVENFKAGFDYESDAVAFSGDIDGTFDGENVTIETDGGTTVLEDVADGEDFAQFKIVDGTTYNAAIAQEGEFIDVTDDKTDVYIGENSGVDFSGYSGQVLIDLDDKRGTVGKTDAQFFGINQLIGGDGITTLIGSSGDETITAGTGRASIWGNWGNDLLIGNTSADKKAGTEFFMFADDGHDTIDHFEFLTAQNSLTADRIYVGTSDINSATLNGDDVVINFDGSSDLTLIDAAGKNIQISDMIAKVDTDVEFDGIANTYIATDSNAELTVADSLGSAEIWLNNSHDAKFYGDIRTIDASNVSGKTTLGGNDLNNTIIAGEGDASLWGSGGNDWLVGGDGHNTFFYLLGNGNDTISGTNTNDELALSDITLDQISETSVTENGASIKFTDGGSLTINGTADVTAVLADGTHYTANHAQKEWVAR